MGRSREDPGVSQDTDMTKLLLVFLAALAVAAITSARQLEQDSSLSEDLAFSRIARSPEADAKRKSRRPKSRASKRKNKSRRQRKRRTRKSKKRGGKRGKKQSAMKAVPGVAADIDEKETNNTINTLNKIDNRATLADDLQSCQTAARQSPAAIIQIRFYVFWCVWFQNSVVEVRITIIVATFNLSPATTTAAAANTTAAAGETTAAAGETTAAAG